MKHIVAGIFAQVDAGKTTLSEALLFETGQLRRRGRVDHGDAFLDHHNLERSRGITIFSKQARFSIHDLSVTLLDTPGHVDFSPEAERAMQVLDYAVLLISGTDGVQAHTQTLWKLLRRYHIPTFVFFNKMDLPDTDRERLLADAKANLSEGCVCLDDTESVALCDEAVLERYLESGDLSDTDISDMIRNEKLFPCLFGAALHSDGVQELLQMLQAYTRTPDYPEEFSAKVYKISRDTQGNRLTFLKLTGGILRVRSMLGEEKVHQLRLYSGASFTQVEQVNAGEVCAVLGPQKLQIGDRIGLDQMRSVPYLTPVMTYRIVLPEQQDVKTALEKLRQMEEEEPLLHIVWDERLREIHAQIMGQVQIEVLQTLVAERFDMQIQIDHGRVSYRETIAETVEGIGHFEPLRHYAEVHLLLSPLPRGSGLVFDSTLSEDTLDRNWQRLILTHLEEKTHLGVLTASPITDMRITLAAGRAHLKHTEGGDFRQATYRAVRQGLMQAESILLEPFYRFKLYVPASQIGRAINDIRAMGGTFASPEDRGEMMLLEGRAPVSEMQAYMSQVISYTKGQGKLLCEVDGYEPCHNAKEIIDKMQYDPETDVENTPDSVFCSHGAGINIKWNAVAEHMHLESVLRSKAPDTPVRIRTQNLDLDEKLLQEIMEREFGPEKYALHRPTQTDTSPSVSLPSIKKEYLIVDGYNMIFAWDGLRQQAQTDLSGARQRLLDILSNYSGYRENELVVVFDSYRVKGGIGSKHRHDNLRVVYTQEHETADAYIEALVGEIGKNYNIRVATSDALIQLSALRSGVLRISANEFLAEIERVNDSIALIIRGLREESRRASIRENPLKTIKQE
ncbi:MAG: GTP-binding protein [Ruminococcaceae bacterium]|nr:GTP-binding protein [Oscillospiraceae bacterium]